MSPNGTRPFIPGIDVGVDYTAFRRRRKRKGVCNAYRAPLRVATLALWDQAGPKRPMGLLRNPVETWRYRTRGQCAPPGNDGGRFGTRSRKPKPRESGGCGSFGCVISSIDPQGGKA